MDNADVLGLKISERFMNHVLSVSLDSLSV